MKKETNIQLFEAKQIRSAWSEADQKWYFSIVDVIEVLTGTDRPRSTGTI
jgi:DNA-damage-inducible protein D